MVEGVDGHREGDHQIAGVVHHPLASGVAKHQCTDDYRDEVDVVHVILLNSTRDWGRSTERTHIRPYIRPLLASKRCYRQHQRCHR